MAIITISRGSRSGGMELAHLLCDKLGYRCISREIIADAAAKFGISKDKLYEAVVKGPSLLQRLSFERERYLAYVQEALCEAVKDDNVIYHGHAGHLLLPSISNVLKVRIVADMKYRIEKSMIQDHLTEKEAIKNIEEVDKQRIKWTKFLYGVDWCSPELYDIVYNIKHMNLGLIADSIAYTIQQPRFETTDKTRKEVDDLLLCSKIKVSVAKIPNVRLEKLKIDVNDGDVTLLGKTRTDELLNEVVDIVRQVDGVTNLTNRLEVDYRYQGIDS